MHPNRREILDQHSWLYRVGTDDRLVNIVRAYFGNQGCSLFYADFWHTKPTNGERIASQRWHRDNEDCRLLKVFIYLNDVTESGGCFEFVKKTSKGLEYGALEPRFRVSHSITALPTTEQFISENQHLVFKGTGRKGDVILCDTTGFHRGGFVQEGCRKLAHFTYTSRRCPHVFYSLTSSGGKGGKIDL